VFGNRDTGAYLVRLAWTKIVRHDLVSGRASPDDPALSEYWARRRRRAKDLPPIGHTRLSLLKRQKGCCPVCGGLLLHADRQPQSPKEWEQWAAAVRKALTLNAIATPGNGPPGDKEQRLVHEHCRRRQPARSTALHEPGCKPSGLA
jgi:RNA-directed DNA polymerase